MTENNGKDIREVLVKVQKLLNMASGKANENESMVAAEMAAKIMSDYNISHADLISEELKNIDSSITDDLISNWDYMTTWPGWITNMVVGISKHFDCEVRYVRSTRRRGAIQLKIYGYTPDVTMAKWIFTYVVNEAMRHADKYLQDNRNRISYSISSRKIKEDFCFGTSARVNNRLDELKKREALSSSCTDLVVVKACSIAKKYGSFTYSDFPNVKVCRSYDAGVLFDDKIPLNQPIEANGEKLRIGGK